MGKGAHKSVFSGRPTENPDSTGVRERIDILRSRVELLSGKDRVLMKMYLENDNTFRQMARLAGVNEATVARRIHRITKRLLAGGYITCLHNGRLNRFEIKIAQDYFLGGLAQHKIAARRKCSLYRVREALKKIQELIRVDRPETTGQKGILVNANKDVQY